MKSILKKIKISEEKEKFRKHLENKSIKMTMGRLRVFDTVMNTHGHFATEKVVKICKKSKTKVSRATIYRSISELLEASIIRKTAFGEKHQNFEHIYDEKIHHHARCIRCHSIIEFPDLGEDKIYRTMLEKKGFQILGHEMHFYGICQSCKNSKN